MSQSVILIPVPSADPVVGTWREKYDRSSLHGIPSHITLLFPFKHPIQITQEIIQKLEILFSKVRRFSFVLDKINTFPNVIFLDPKPRNLFIELTEAIVRIFPENQPYEGKYTLINPHLTIGESIETQKMNPLKEEITQDIQNKLPIQTNATVVWLMTESDGEWKIKRKFAFKT